MVSLTKQKQQINSTFITYYQGFLAIAAILVFFTRLDIYLQGRGFVIPLYWLMGFLLASFPLFLLLIRRLDNFSTPVLVWCAAYIALSCTLILIQPKFPSLQFLEDNFRTLIFLVLMLGIFAYNPLVTRWVRLTILSVTLLNVCMFVYEFFNPFAFYLVQRAEGRSAGFYEDSNTASIALILGMIFTIDMIKPKYRLMYALFIFLGIAPTFSRGSIVGWFLVVAYLVVKKVIPRYQMPLLALFFLIAISILSTHLNSLSYLETPDGTKLFHKDTLDRVEFLINPLAQKDDSKASRQSHVEVAWKKFQASPFIGNGLGSGQNAATMSLVGEAQRSHNTYLDLMVEFGFSGAFIFPALLFACIRQAQGEFKKQAGAFMLFMLAQGFFSHTLVSEFCSLIAYAIMANLSRYSSVESSADLEQTLNYQDVKV